MQQIKAKSFKLLEAMMKYKPPLKTMKIWVTKQMYSSCLPSKFYQNIQQNGNKKRTPHEYLSIKS